ncbi:MAG: pyruvate dehydrogenase (acetyl-transferring) E1 component subunit alpha [Acidimicrobiales bacterium]|nr:pyruvate dehydrogenase (acetyl-transferring) E1 component subunit alpha [Acidimicrobiales bacterium]
MAEVVRTPTLIPELEPVQLLAPDGRRLPSDDWDVDLSDDDLVGMYVDMAVARALDQEFIHLQRQGHLALYASCRGQEGAQVGSAAALHEDDWIFPQYRELGVFVHRRMDVPGMSEFWRGSWHSGHDCLASRCAPLCIPIATHTLHGVGYAMGVALDGAHSAVVVYLGDGATSEGDTHEAMNFASVFGAPCVFFLQNNQWAISVPVSEQSHAPSLAHRGVAYGIPAVRCDGNDVLASYAVSKWALERARRGEGPSLIEAVTYRMEAHTTSDDPTRYRSAAEVEHWRQLDPIDRLVAHLRLAGTWSAEVEQRATSLAAEQCAELRRLTIEAPETDPAEVFEHVYADPPAEFRREAAEYTEWQRGGLAGEGAP